VVRLRRRTGFGAERLRQEFRLPVGVSAIARSHGWVRARVKKPARKKQLRARGDQRAVVGGLRR
jgi:hypothetical protein